MYSHLSCGRQLTMSLHAKKKKKHTHTHTHIQNVPLRIRQTQGACSTGHLEQQLSYKPQFDSTPMSSEVLP
jgi:hypothetical protein